MKKLILASAALAALVATPAFATPSTADINHEVVVTGTVAAKCELAGLQNGTTEFDISGDISNDQGNLNTNAQAVVTGVSSLLNGLTIWCNGASTNVSLSAQPFHTTDASATAGFKDRIDYVIAADVGAASLDIDTSGATSKSAYDNDAYNGAFTGTLAVAVTVTDPASQLIAGDYSASIELHVTPAV